MKNKVLLLSLIGATLSGCAGTYQPNIQGPKAYFSVTNTDHVSLSHLFSGPINSSNSVSGDDWIYVFTYKDAAQCKTPLRLTNASKSLVPIAANQLTTMGVTVLSSGYDPVRFTFSFYPKVGAKYYLNSGSSENLLSSQAFIDLQRLVVDSSGHPVKLVDVPIVSRKSTLSLGFSSEGCKPLSTSELKKIK